MSKPLPLNDFRAVRVVLEPQDFALGPKTERPPSDPIDKDTWHSIMDLPDDVSIRISNNHGSQLKQIHELWGVWIEAIGEDKDYLSYTMIETTDEFDSVTFNSLHGFYRQAIGSLRNALELVIIGAYCQVCTKATEFTQWSKGKTEISFGKACDCLWGAPAIQPLNKHLHNVVGDSIFDRKKNKTYAGGWARRIYSELSNYAHSRPTFTNAEMWASNGPIYEPKAFESTIALLLQVYVLCYILVKLSRSSFVLPEPCKELFKLGTFPWMKIAYHSYDYLFQQREKPSKWVESVEI
jgi:hypothetical protein